MILRSVKVKGMRCFRSEVSVGPFGEGLNLIYAPNETGKSTLVEAVSRALFDKYSVGGQEIEALRPWGTPLSPEIELEFEANERTLRLRKRLLDDAICTLEETRKGSWTLLAERDQADEFVRKLLHGALPGRGPTKLEHRGLARMLWCLQEPGAERTYSLSSAVADQLRAVLPGEVRFGAKSDTLTARLDELHEGYFTPTGRVKKRSVIDRLQEEMAKLQEEEQTAQEACVEVDRTAEQLTDISSELGRLEEEKDTCEQRIEQYEAEAQALRNLRKQIETLEGQVECAEQDYADAAKDLERYQEAEQVAEQCTGQLQDIERELSESATAVKAAQALVREGEKELQEAEEARRGASEAWERGRKANRALQLKQEYQQLLEKGRRLAELISGVQQQRAELESMPCPSRDQMTEARGLQQEITQLQAQLEVAGLQGEVHVVSKQEVVLSGGVEALSQELEAGDMVTYQAGAALDVELAGVAHVKVTSGAREPGELEQSLDVAREKLNSVLTAFAADDPDDLQRLQTEFELQREDVDRKEEEIERAAEPYESAEELRTAQAQKSIELQQLLNELGLSEQELGAIRTHDEEALQTALDQAQAEEERLRRRLEDRREQHEKARERQQNSRTKQAEFLSTQKQEFAVMQTVLERAECEDAGTLQEKAEQLRTEAAVLKRQVEDKRGQLPPPETDPEELLKTQKSALGDIQNRERDLLDQRGKARGIIERAWTEGLYERMSAVQEKLNTNREHLRHAWQDAQAIKLLRQVLTERRETAVSGQLPGLEEAVTRMLRHITGRARLVQMGSELQVEGVATETDLTARPVEQLSAGTREQLDLVARIALGEAYAKHYGRTMMVLDDALLYTDPVRHDRVKEILKRSANLLQVFILTSHPDRYRGIVPQECCFDLSQLTG